MCKVLKEKAFYFLFLFYLNLNQKVFFFRLKWEYTFNAILFIRSVNCIKL